MLSMPGVKLWIKFAPALITTLPTSMFAFVMTLPWLETVSTVGGAEMLPSRLTSGLTKCAPSKLAFSGADASKVLAIVTAGGVELLSACTRENVGTVPLLLTCPMAEALLTEVPSKRTVPPELCGMVIWLIRRKAGLLFVMVMLTS